jgi:hypothetical protein
MKYILDRLSEPSTWIGGMGIIAGLFHFSIAPDKATAIASLGVAAAGVAAAALKDKSSQ